jgi:hypothetical protein
MTRASLRVRLRAMTRHKLPSAWRNAAPDNRVLRAEAAPVPPASTRRQEALQRLQIGVIGLAAMVLLVGLASIIGRQADATEQAAVPDAAPTTEPSPVPSQANPLADAGVVPDIVAEPSPAPGAARDRAPPSASGSAKPAP